jgi:protein TonB
VLPAGLPLVPALEPGSLDLAEDSFEFLAPPPPPSSRAQGSSDEVAPSAVTRPPDVRNLTRVQEALIREYPIGLREAGIGGRVQLLFFVDREGKVERVQVEQSSGNVDLDRAALRVGQVFEFSPGLRGIERVAATVSLGVTFGGSGG